MPGRWRWATNGIVYVGSQRKRHGDGAAAAATRREAGGDPARQRPERPQRGGLPGRRAVRGRDQPHPALRRHHRTPARPARAGGGHRSLPARDPPRLEVHRLRARRQAVRAGRRTLQCVRARPRPLRADLQDQPGRDRLRGLRTRCTQQRRLRLGPAHGRAVVRRARPRHDGRRHALRRAEPRAARGARLRLPVLPSGRHARTPNSAPSAHAATSSRPP